MKHIDIVIPTRNRYIKLLRCLQSIPQNLDGVGLTVVVVCDGDDFTARKLIAQENGQVSRVIMAFGHKGSVYCRNLATQAVEDALIYATDDIEFRPRAINAAIAAMARHFPDEDGVVGFNQVNAQQFSPAGVGLVGQRFLRRYPNRKLFYPGYFHFSCQEIERLGKKLGRLHLEETAHIIHHHPFLNKGEHDSTHREAREHRKADKTLSSARRAKKIIWGDSS